MYSVAHICTETYANKVKIIFISFCRPTAECVEFIRSIYADEIMTCAHELIGICGI